MTQLKDYKPLFLAAAEARDLEVISAMAQDAITKIGDIAWLPAKRRFALVANRFVWEAAADKERGPFARVRTGLHFDDVIAVRQQSLRLDAPGAVLNLLSVEPVPQEGRDGDSAEAEFGTGNHDTGAPQEIDLVFAGGGTIRLTVEAISAELRDFSDPWVTRSKPTHQTAD
ncbi:MAG: DUF2948 family protein [Pseudomonadota bacterium]